MKKQLAFVLLASLMVAERAYAQTAVKASQGAPGNQGPWPVKVIGTLTVITGGSVGPDGGAVPVQGKITVVGPDGGAVVVQGTVVSTGPDGGAVVVQDLLCTHPVESFLVSDGGAAPCPLPLAGRRTVLLCNSPMNAGAPFWKIRADGIAPTLVVASEGQPLGLGDCINYTISSVSDDGGVPLWCIADTVGAVISGTECK